MKMSLTGLASRKEIGLAIGEREAAACVVAVTPIRRVEVSRSRVAYDPEGLASGLARLLEAAAGPDELPRCRVVVGLPALRVFFSARPIQVDERDASPVALLHEVLQSPTLVIDEMFVDMIKHRSGQRTVACIVSCRKKYLNTIIAALQAGGVRPTRSEPAPCALLRLAARRHRPPRGTRALVRVFLGAGHGLAVLSTSHDLPLMWRPFSLPAGRESDAILAAVASVRSPGMYCGLDSDIGAVLIHGRPDFDGLAELAANPALKGVRILHHEGPALDEGEVASGLACQPSRRIEPFDLIRSFGGHRPFRETFPWGQALIHAAVLAVATLLLQNRLASHRAEAAAARAGDARHTWATGSSAEQLRVEARRLEQRIDAVGSFLASRTIWSNHAIELTGRLPPDVSLASLAGSHELETPGDKGVKPRHSLILRLDAPIPRTGTMPREIDAFLQTLRDDPILKREFPQIELADLRWTQLKADTPVASFSVVCQPTKAAGPRAKVR